MGARACVRVCVHVHMRECVYVDVRMRAYVSACVWECACDCMRNQIANYKNLLFLREICLTPLDKFKLT